MNFRFKLSEVSNLFATETILNSLMTLSDESRGFGVEEDEEKKPVLDEARARRHIAFFLKNETARDIVSEDTRY